MSSAGQTAIVTGAGGGVGLSIARDLLDDDANVTLIDLKNRPEDLDRGPGRALYLQGDVADDDFVGQAIAQTFAQTGRLDSRISSISF